MNMELIVFAIIWILWVELIYWIWVVHRVEKFFSGKTISLFIAILPTTLFFLIYLIYKELHSDIDPMYVKIAGAILGVLALIYGINYSIYKLVKSKKW